MRPLLQGPGLKTSQILAKALAGQPPSVEEAYALIHAEGPDLEALLEAASALRDRYKGRTVTYSRKVFIPLTNLCRDTCSYCTFVKQPWEASAHTMTPEEVVAVARAGKLLGCKEALFSLGDKPELKYPTYRRWLAERGYDSTLHYLADMCRLVFQKTGLLPHANPGLLTEADIAMLRPYNVSMGVMLENVSPRLLRPGMPHHRCPDKVPKRRLQTIEAAGRQRVAFTTGILIGIGETPEERVDSLFAIRDLQTRYGHIQEVIVQNFRAKPDIAMWDHPEPTLDDMLRTIAVARLVLQEMNIQAPPNLAPREYRWYLRAGINDWGGISPLTQDFINPEAPWPKLRELQEVCREEGFQLRERLALYPEYVRRGEEFVPEALRERVRALTDASGLVRPEAEGPI
jgi:FO synthase